MGNIASLKTASIDGVVFHDVGDMGFIDAAVEMARRFDDDTYFEWVDDVITIYVREPNTQKHDGGATTYCFRIKRSRNYLCLNPRQELEEYEPTPKRPRCLETD